MKSDVARSVLGDAAAEELQAEVDAEDRREREEEEAQARAEAVAREAEGEGDDQAEAQAETEAEPEAKAGESKDEEEPEAEAAADGPGHGAGIRFPSPFSCLSVSSGFVSVSYRQRCKQAWPWQRSWQAQAREPDDACNDQGHRARAGTGQEENVCLSLSSLP